MAHIRLNEEQWNSLSDDQQSEIIQIMRDTGLLRDRDEIIPDPDAPSVSMLRLPEVSAGRIKEVLCKTACTAAEAAAITACAHLIEPLAVAACIAAAHALGEECRRRCAEEPAVAPSESPSY
jgi:hypothetical protein